MKDEISRCSSCLQEVELTETFTAMDVSEAKVHGVMCGTKIFRKIEGIARQLERQKIVELLTEHKSYYVRSQLNEMSKERRCDIGILVEEVGLWIDKIKNL